MMNSTIIIAKKDFEDAIRSRLLWGLIVALVVFTIPQVFNHQSLFDTVEQATEGVALHVKPFVPLLGVVVGYGAVVGERESGRLKVLLGLPGTRRDVVLGKLVGRSLVLMTALLIGLCGTGIAIVAIYGNLAVDHFIGIGLLSFLYGLSWIGLSVGISAGVSSRFRAVAGVFGVFTLFVLFWQQLVLPILTYLFTGQTSTKQLEPIALADGPAWYLYAQRINPVQAYEGGRIFISRLVDPTVTASGSYLENGFGLTMLVLWFSIPVIFGYWQFRRVDLE